MYFGGVLLQVGGQYMFGFFDGDVIDVINDFVNLIIVLLMCFFCEFEIVV